MQKQTAKVRFINEAASNPPQKILRLPKVTNRTGLPRSTLYLLISEGSFPSPISLGVRSVGWLESEIDAWIEKRINESRNENGGKQ